MGMATRYRMGLAAGLLFVPIAASAQYKSIGVDGRVTYSDVLPPPPARIVEQKKLGSVVSEPALPFEVRQAVTKYPVTIYTGDRCAPCDDARGYLRSRGVPFVEKTVTSDEDIALFRQQSSDGTAPVVLVGGRKAIGFSQATLASLLDNAGYPATSTLPREFQNATPTPLSPTTHAPGQTIAPAASTARRGTAAAPQLSTPPADNPSGFRF
ncbi:MAG: glutaredoxin family protein [Burkholderiaceae bacterium]